MDAQDLIHAVLRGALGGRRKPGRRALGYLTRGKGSFLNASTLLSLGGLAYGVFEAATRKPDGFTGTEAPAAPPPLPQQGVVSATAVEPALRLVRLAISAACADGTLQEAEKQAILEQARRAGVEALVEAELDERRPLAQIVAGVSELNQRQDLYVLAYAIVRADQGVSGAERIYLAQLAHQLVLSADETKALEELAAARIDAHEEAAEA